MLRRFIIFNNCFQEYRFCIKNQANYHHQHFHSCHHFHHMFGYFLVLHILLYHAVYLFWVDWHHLNGIIHIRVLKNQQNWKINLHSRIRCGFVSVHYYNKALKLRQSKYFSVLTGILEIKLKKKISFSEHQQRELWLQFGGFLH